MPVVESARVERAWVERRVTVAVITCQKEAYWFDAVIDKAHCDARTDCQTQSKCFTVYYCHNDE